MEKRIQLFVLVFSLLLVGVLYSISLSVYDFKDRGEENREVLLAPNEGSGFNVVTLANGDTYALSNVPNTNTGSRFVETVLDNAIIFSDGSVLEWSGYVVELDAPPLVVKQNQLKESGMESQSIQSSLDSYSATLKTNKETVKQNIYNLLQGSSPESMAISGASSLKIGSEFQNVLNGFSLDITSEEAKLVETISGVKRVSPNFLYKTTLQDSVPLIGANQVWNLDSNGGDCSVSGLPCLTGEGVTMGIIDTGVDYTHSDLGGCLGVGCKVVGGYDFVNNDGDPMDDNGHGTHVAATAAGNGVLKGVAPNANIYVYKVLDNGGSGSLDNIIGAIDRSLDPNQDGDFSDYLDVISLSLGLDCKNSLDYTNGVYSDFCGPNDLISRALDNVVDAGVIAVVAAGNSGQKELPTIGSPGTSVKAITVGASDKLDKIASFSSRGPVIWENNFGVLEHMVKPDIVAPGVSICAAQWNNAYGGDCLGDGEHVSISGTSMATPHVSGAVALFLQKNPDWTPEEVKMALRNTALDIGYNKATQGSGRIDLYGAANLANLPSDFFEAAITFPFDKKVFGTNALIEIKGIYPNSYDNLELVYYEKNNPSIIFNQGINLILDNDVIGTFDASAITERGFYIFKLSVSKNGKLEEDFVEIYIDNTLELGFPVRHHSFVIQNSPTTYDINNDGIDEILIGLDDGFSSVVVLNSTGEIIWEYFTEESNGCMFPSVSVGDVVSGGTKEIIFTSCGEEVYMLNSSGSKLQKWFTDDTGHCGGFLNFRKSSPVLEDVDNDNELEIIIGSEDGQVYVLEADGTFLSGWPQPTSQHKIYGCTGFESTPVVADIDNNGDLEIIVAGYDGNLHVWNDSGTYYSGAWPVVISDYEFKNSPILVDVNNDGYLEIFLQSADSKIYGYGINGELLDGNWPVMDVSIRSSRKGGLAAGDVNNDGDIEIVVAGYSKIHILDSLGNSLGNWPIQGGKLIYSSSPILVDINNDGYLEIFQGNIFGEINGYDYNGNELFGFPKFLTNLNYMLTTTPSIGNIDQDSNLEMVVGGKDGYIYAWDLGGFSDITGEWPQYQHDAQHTGNYHFEVVSPIPISEPVAHYNFDEASGNVLNDVSGNGNAGTVYGATWTYGTYNGGLSFDGVNDYVLIPHSSELALTEGFTIAGWIKPNTLSAGSVLCKGNLVTDPDYLLYMGFPVQGAIGFYDGTSWTNSNSGFINANEWNHVAFVYDGTQHVYYLNGVPQGSIQKTGSVQTSANNLMLGQQCAAGANPFKGSMDEVKIYSQALSSQEISDLYWGSGSPGKVCATFAKTIGLNFWNKGMFSEAPFATSSQTDCLVWAEANLYGEAFCSQNPVVAEEAIVVLMDKTEWEKPLNQISITPNQIVDQRPCFSPVEMVGISSFIVSPDCTDSDLGLSPSTPGSLTDGSNSASEYCQGNVLREFVCGSSIDTSFSGKAAEVDVYCDNLVGNPNFVGSCQTNSNGGYCYASPVGGASISTLENSQFFAYCGDGIKNGNEYCDWQDPNAPCGCTVECTQGICFSDGGMAGS